VAHLRTLQTQLKMTDVIRSCAVVAVLVCFLAGGSTVGNSSRGAEKPTGKTSRTSAKSTSATKIDGIELTDEDLYVDLNDDLSALIVPARFLMRATPTDRLKFSVEVQGLLSNGFKPKGDGLEAARKHLESAHLLMADDPRASYAYGIVLLAQKNSVLALQQFRTSGRLKKAPFLPALQAIAWLRLSQGEYALALSALLDLAHRLEESQEAWPTELVKEQSAEWLGQMIGFLVGPGKNAEQAAPIEKLAADVDRLLTGERKQACERGRKEAAARYDELKAFAARPSEELLAEAKQTPEEIMAAAAAAESEARQLAEELKELKQPHDKLLADLGREIRSKAALVKSTITKVGPAEADVDEFSTPKLHPQFKIQGTRPSAKVAGRKENAGEQKIRESQLASAERTVEHLMATIETAKQDVADARKRRDEAQAEYRQATAGKRQAHEAALYRSAELAARARDAEQGTLTPAKLKARVTALESYVPLYPELEKDRLLATLKIAQ